MTLRRYVVTAQRPGEHSPTRLDVSATDESSLRWQVESLGYWLISFVETKPEWCVEIEALGGWRKERRYYFAATAAEARAAAAQCGYVALSVWQVSP